MRPVHRMHAAVLAGVLQLAAAAAGADVVVLKNGDRLTGKVERMRGGKLELATSHSGTVAIDAEAIESLSTDTEVTVVLKDYSRLIGTLSAGAGRMAVQGAAGEPPVAVDPKRVQVLLPGRWTEQDWRVTGRVNLGVSDTAGNTEVQRFNGDAEVVARRNRDRWGLAARANEAAERREQTEMNAVVALKYDRFVTERWYAYGGGTLEHDRFKDLRLRSTAGVGAGHQLFDTARGSLALEAGVDRVRADYFGALDERFYALRLASRLEWWLWPDVVQLFNNNQGFASLSDIRESFVRTQSGLRFPLRGGFVTSVLLNVDWDGTPAPGRRPVDRQLVLSLGYKW